MQIIAEFMCTAMLPHDYVCVYERKQRCHGNVIENSE